MKQLLEELYKIEPELREKEEQIGKIITHMMAIKPKVITPENFKKGLSRRLISGMAPDGNERRIPTKNKRFRIFWYILGAGAFASFAISYGFLSIFEPSNTKNIPRILNHTSTLQETPKESATYNTPIATSGVIEENTDSQALALNSVNRIQDEPEINKKTLDKKGGFFMKKSAILPEKIHTPLALNTEKIMKEAVLPVSSSQPAVASIMSITAGIISSPAETEESLIAYVGEEVYIWTPMETANGSASGDSMLKTSLSPQLMMEPLSDSTISGQVSTGSIGYSWNEAITVPRVSKVSKELTFSGIVSIAQKEASDLVEKKDRSFYVLRTPHVSYISRESSSGKNTVEMVQVYIFPLERVDGKESKIQEVSVMVP